jgi:hypothetical protein
MLYIGGKEYDQGGLIFYLSLNPAVRARTTCRIQDFTSSCLAAFVFTLLLDELELRHKSAARNYITAICLVQTVSQM